MCEQELRAAAAGLSRLAAGRLPGLFPEELRQSATTTKQVGLQEVLWKKGPLSLFVFSANKGFYKYPLMCSARLSKMGDNATTDYIYDWKSYHRFIFVVFYKKSHFMG